MIASRRAAFAAAMVLALAAAGCGGSTVKRAVDARTEVLHFYPVDAPAVALLRPRPIGAVAELDRVARGLPAWRGLRGLTLGPLRAAGLGPADLRRLVRPQDEIEDFDAAALTVGATSPENLAARRTLLVLATDQDELLDDLLAKSVKDGSLEPTGSLDEASLYRNATASYAARDGVLISAQGPAEVRTAIERRDGDEDEQLDEGVVNTALQKLREPAPLLLYGEMTRLLEEPDVAQLLAGASWIDSADDAAASVQAVGETVEIEVVVNLERNLEPAERPLEEEPQSFGIAISGIGSLSGAGSATSDEVRVQLRAVPPP